jgi:hypothetical protein
MQSLLLLHFRRGEGPQEGTPEFDEEMRRWGELNDELREAGVVLGARACTSTPSRRCALPAAS